jgi:hypothetical protein
MPMRARNGARMVFLSMTARVRAICAAATSRWARAVSSSISEAAFRSIMRCMRWSCVSASWRCASCACSSACSTETSRPTRTVPASTIWPGVRFARFTVPASSLRTVIERSATTVPMDVVVR